MPLWRALDRPLRSVRRGRRKVRCGADGSTTYGVHSFIGGRPALTAANTMLDVPASKVLRAVITTLHEAASPRDAAIIHEENQSFVGRSLDVHLS